MGFEGLSQPGQMNLYTGANNPYLAANAAKLTAAKSPLVKKTEQDEAVTATQRDDRDNAQPDDEDERGERFSEEEAGAIRHMATLRGVLNLALEAGKRYEFQLDAASGLVNLISMETGECILQLYPEELMQLSQKIQRYAGMLTNRAG